MTDYHQFLKSKHREHLASGFEITEDKINPKCLDFQKYIIRIALKKGRFAIFADCGLGKTFMQLEWANQVCNHTGGEVLILAPLAVVGQTKKEAKKFGIDLKGRITIINYEQIDNIDHERFAGVVLDESSILKGFQRKTSSALIQKFRKTPYRLACTATPSPNDHVELGQHAEFLGVCRYLEMLAQYFVHDGGETSKWRLRKHAEDDFWRFVCTWAISLDNPKTLGFSGEGYDLPEINYIEHIIPVEREGGTLFQKGAVSAMDLGRDLRFCLEDRLAKVKEIIGSSKEQFIVWGLHNEETTRLEKLLDGSINVQGNDSPEYKAEHLLGFADQKFQLLVSKTSIASFGMNYQQCHNMIFCSYDFKFEAFYQAVRRCYRFGQTKPVNVHIIIPETQMNVRSSILKKEGRHKLMIHKMSEYSAEHQKGEFVIPEKPMHSEIKTDDFWLMNDDCVRAIKMVPDESVHLSIFSPPFAELYVYSDKAEDMGNVKNHDEFSKHFSYLVPELFRVLKPGRIVGIHCMDLPIQKGKEGVIGLRDFSGMLIKMFSDAGFIYHSRVTIWKNPVTEMQRTKALGLLHKQIKKDSAMCRVGIPDYVLFFRKKGDNAEPIRHQDTDPSRPDYLPVDLWQKYASPIWYDIVYNRTLQYTTARDGNDEKHIAPLQLDTIERIIHLFSNVGDTILSPFGGIGSEGYQALKMGRKSISIELKPSYFAVNIENHRKVSEQKMQLTID